MSVKTFPAKFNIPVLEHLLYLLTGHHVTFIFSLASNLLIKRNKLAVRCSWEKKRHAVCRSSQKKTSSTVSNKGKFGWSAVKIEEECVLKMICIISKRKKRESRYLIVTLCILLEGISNASEFYYCWKFFVVQKLWTTETTRADIDLFAIPWGWLNKGQCVGNRKILFSFHFNFSKIYVTCYFFPVKFVFVTTYVSRVIYQMSQWVLVCRSIVRIVYCGTSFTALASPLKRTIKRRL